MLSTFSFSMITLVIQLVAATVFTNRLVYYAYANQVHWFLKFGAFWFFFILAIPLIVLAVPLRLIGIKMFPVFVNEKKW